MPSRIAPLLVVALGLLAAACGPGASPSAPLPSASPFSTSDAGSDRTGVAGRATGGPTCPVERPGDPSCAPRLLGGVELLIQDAGGTEVASVTTDGSGFFRLALPPGDYVLVPPTVEGFMGTPGPVEFSVVDGEETWLDLGWDTGIR